MISEFLGKLQYQKHSWTVYKITSLILYGWQSTHKVQKHFKISNTRNHWINQSQRE